ncbi:MAG: hypothetical protein A3K19_10335 [Lentisphaerae bacterium RIFOXYB12_FULL_65_16]|nr:MAG: hypothetical protein A3K18_32195 [Lentisphaerae bacterium RIFOXYA12_64_32]OGV91614.1 MAG: hypothetical protein A3K19_10335 [Lentisphaerae bacterium RIFOXYB12_FULL_65_16]
MLTSTSLNIFPLYAPPRETLRGLREVGFGAVDFNYCDYAGDPGLLGAKFAAYLDELGAAGSETGIRFYQAHAPCIAPWHDAAERARLLSLTDHCMGTAARLGIQWVVFHPLTEPGFLPGYDAPTLLETNRLFALDMLQRSRGRSGVAIENCGGGGRRWFADSAAELVALVDAVNDPLCGVCWDTGHGHMARADQAASLAKLGAHLKCLHVQDNDGNADLHLLPLAVQKGVDWLAVARGLAQAQFTGPFNFEVHNAFRDVPPELFDTVLHHAGKLASRIAGLAGNGER